MSKDNDKNLSDIYAKEHQNKLELLAKLKQKAKTEAELQELIDFERQLKETKPDPEAVKIYNQLRDQPNIIMTTSSSSEFANIKSRLTLFVYISAGLFVFSIFIVPQLAISQNSSNYLWLWYQLLFAIVLSPIFTVFIYRYQSLDKFFYRMVLMFFPAMLWGLLGIRLAFILTPIETVDAFIDQYDHLESNKLDSCKVKIKTDIEILERYIYPIPCRQDLKKHDKVILRYRQNFIGVTADFKKN